MKFIELTETEKSEVITVAVENIKTLKDQIYNYGNNYTLITFIDDNTLKVKEKISFRKEMINQL